MRTTPPPLIPILRTSAQAEILALVMGDPDAEWSITGLAQAAGTSIATAGREVARAQAAQLVKVRKVGRNRLVSANTASEYFEPMARLLLLSFGPRRLISECLAGVSGIEEAYLFGSWAERYRGHDGPAPNDIDVLIVGRPDRSQVYEAIEPLEQELGRPIQVVFRTSEEWQSTSDPFVATVRARPLVPLVDNHGDAS